MDKTHLSKIATRSISKQILDLVRDDEGQQYLGNQPSCIDSVVNLLRSVDTETVFCAAQTIRYLSGNYEVRGKICQHPHVLSSIVCQF